tara:strand:+ start:1058 stop:1189 length:132 start_codon:yes stop_codon:yes gene_type:complete
MYADQLETFAILLVAVLAMLFFGIPSTENALSYFFGLNGYFVN